MDFHGVLHIAEYVHNVDIANMDIAHKGTVAIGDHGSRYARYWENLAKIMLENKRLSGGGPGTNVPPDVSFENFRYFINLLKEIGCMERLPDNIKIKGGEL